MSKKYFFPLVIPLILTPTGEKKNFSFSNPAHLNASMSEKKILGLGLGLGLGLE